MPALRNILQLDNKIMKNVQKTIKRYLRIYAILLRLNLVQLFAYRANFISSLIAHTVWGAFVLISMLLLTSRISHVAGWSRDELLVLAGIYNVIFSIFYFLFSRNFGEISNTIHFGRLDGILAKPIDSQFLITCTFVSYTHIVRFILGLSFLLIILLRMHVSFSLVSVLSFILFVILSVMIMYSLWFSVMTLTLWFTKLSNLADLLYELNGIARFPREIYKGVGMYMLIFLFPLTVVIVSPAKALLQKMLLGDILWPIILAVLLFWFSRKFWQYALRSYTSASG